MATQDRYVWVGGRRGVFIVTSEINTIIVGGYQLAIKYLGARCRRLEARVKELEASLDTQEEVT